jgi:hypothetical protein
MRAIPTAKRILARLHGVRPWPLEKGTQPFETGPRSIEIGPVSMEAGPRSVGRCPFLSEQALRPSAKAKDGWKKVRGASNQVLVGSNQARGGWKQDLRRPNEISVGSETFLFLSLGTMLSPDCPRTPSISSGTPSRLASPAQALDFARP